MRLLVGLKGIKQKIQLICLNKSKKVIWIIRRENILCVHEKFHSERVQLGEALIAEHDESRTAITERASLRKVSPREFHSASLSLRPSRVFLNRSISLGEFAPQLARHKHRPAPLGDPNCSSAFFFSISNYAIYQLNLESFEEPLSWWMIWAEDLNRRRA